MHYSDPIRRWQQLGLCTLLCLISPGLAMAQTQTPAPLTRPAPASATPAKKHPTSQHATTQHKSTHTSTHTLTHASAQKNKSSRGKKSAKKRGQQAIDSARAREIQTVLIREHYLQGQPTGTWDAATQAAMKRYQEDHGWQSQTTPDSRALIKLGLGPSHDRLLNPESAMTMTMPATPAATDPNPNPKTGDSQIPANSARPKQ